MKEWWLTPLLSSITFITFENRLSEFNELLEDWIVPAAKTTA